VYKAECGSEASYYIHAAMCIWETIMAYPQCVRADILLLALKNMAPGSYCETCATTMVNAILRQYDWNVSPASWRMGNMNHDIPDMLIDYMNWTVKGKKKVVTTTEKR
jgi:hypothetical protein